MSEEKVEKRAFLEFTRTKKIEIELRRIANALEMFLKVQYNVDMNASSPLKEESSAEYSDDMATLRHELEDDMDKRVPDDAPY